jgi:gliding motility-associated-like protein
MKKLLLSFVATLMLGFITFAQTQKQLPSKVVHKSIVHNGVIRCATMEADSILRAEHPEMGTLDQNEVWLQQKIAEHKAKYKGQQKLPILTIPVVVHVIHNGDAVGSGENIPDGQVLSQVQVLNEDYRKMLGTPGYNTDPVGADVEIEFCMAVVDPSGNPTNGIDRSNQGQASWTSMSSIDGTLKPATIWDPTQYMNMWTVRFGGGMNGTLGYAQFPDNSGLPGLGASGGAANSDGVVSSFDAFGSQNIFPGGTYNPTYNLGRTMTHEVGHWLGLRHIWGDANCGDDFCADTPQSQTSNFGCPTGQVTCDGIQDMVENYMDYTDDACMNIFTQDQKTRIRTVMTVSPRRMELPNSNKCTPPNPDDAGVSAIISPNGTICGSTTFAPQITITNYGNNDITSVDIVYDIDGVGSQTYNWTGTLTPSSSVNVTLPAMTTTVGGHTFNASTNLPNGNADSNTGNDGTSVSFTISNGTGVTLTINTDCWGYEVYWEVVDGASTVVASGGNTGTTIPPGGGQTATAGDAGAYGNEVTVTENLCLNTGCYDLIMYDDYGDGLGGGGGCTTVGDYNLTDDGTGTLLVGPVTGDYGASQTDNFCIGPVCTTSAGTMNTTPLTLCGSGAQTATHNGDNVNDGNDALQFILHDVSGITLGTVLATSNSPTFSFQAGMTYGTTYYISAISGDDSGGGVVDLNDACLKVAAGTPVTWYDNPTVVANATATSICAGDPVTLTGSGASTYTWDNGVTDGSAFNPTSTTNYTVTGTDANGCSGTDNITVTVNPVPSFTVSSTDPTTCGGNDGSIVLTGLQSGQSYQVTYADNGSNVGPSAMTANGSGVITISGLSAGSYSNFVVDNSGCSSTDNSNVSLSDPASFTISTTVVDETCSSSNGEITITANGASNPIQYSIDNGTSYVSNSLFTGLSAGTYNIAVQDGSGCQSFAQATIVNTPGPSITSVNTTDATCNGDTDGTITITATGTSLNYDLDGGTAQATNSFTGLSAGTYTVNVVDGNGCTASQSATINEPSAISVTPTVTDAACGGANGEISLSVSGGNSPYSYSWTHDATLTTSTAQNLAGGSYDYTVSDVNGCSTNGSANVAGGSNNIEVYVSSVNVSCKGESDGYAVVDSVVGGNPPFSYSWDNGVDDLSITNIPENIYTVTVTDGSGCEKTKAIAITYDAETCLDVHNAISPNGDGQNDTWVVTGIKGYDEAKVAIFNRWGALLFESDNYDNDWKGTYKGKDLPAGIYYFIVTVKNQSDEEPTVLKGSITIIR